MSRHVNFVENSFPYQSIIKPFPTCPLIPQYDSTLHSIIHVKKGQNTNINEFSNSAPVFVVPTPSLLLQPESSSSPLSEPSLSPQHELSLSLQPDPSLSLQHEPTSVGIPVIKYNSPSSTINFVPDQVPSLESNNPVQRDPLVTRSQHNIFKPKKIFVVTKHDLQENLEPSTITQALKISHWIDACSAEFNALMNNGTWTLVPRLSHTNVVGCKWLFQIKRNSDGSVSQYKARLVAKGFTQTPGLDFKEIFAPVVKTQTIKVVLTLALGQGWSLHQMDVNNSFL